MKIKFWKYTLKDDGLKVVIFLEAIGFEGVSIIGSLRKKGHSNNDIDIYIAEADHTVDTRHKLLRAFGTQDYTISDWGSLYLKDTVFGTLDIFFKGQTDKFDF